MRTRLCLAALVAVACISGRASAQDAPRSEAVRPLAVDSAAAPELRASTIDRPSEAVRRSAVATPAPLPQATKSMGQAKAMMAVGGAAIVIGALVDGDGGQVLMLGGAVVGLYGLWLYLK